MDAGCINVVNVEGGIDAWESSDLPVVKNREAFALERQVKVVAGSIVLAGSILSLTLHVGFAIVPIFVGAGLVFSGIFNICGLGSVLAKMPWNNWGKVLNRATA